MAKPGEPADASRGTRIRAVFGRMFTDNPPELGDFTATRRLVYMAALALPLGVLSTFVAWALLRLIAFHMEPQGGAR